MEIRITKDQKIQLLKAIKTGTFCTAIFPEIEQRIKERSDPFKQIRENAQLDNNEPITKFLYKTENSC